MYVTGHSQGVGTDDDATTIAYDAATGVELWSNRYDGTAGDDEGVAIAFAPKGARVYVTGDTTGPTSGADVLAIGYDAMTGERKWVTTYDGSAHDSDDGKSIAVSPNGSLVFVLGLTNSKRTGLDVLTLALGASSGALAWFSRYDSGGGNGDAPSGEDQIGSSSDGDLERVEAARLVGGKDRGRRRVDRHRRDVSRRDGRRRGCVTRAGLQGFVKG